MLPKAFYNRDTTLVARELLGCVLKGPGREPFVIVETEAYLGVSDPAAHTFQGRRTPRVAPMWGPGGQAYVYRVYGLHDCLNVVTREEGRPEAVLIRAAIPLAFWGTSEGDVAKGDLLSASGPGRLCRRLGIARDLSGTSLAGPHLLLSRGVARDFSVLCGPRVGVDYAGEAAAWPLRFAVAGCSAVTKRAQLRMGLPDEAGPVTR